MRIVLDCSVALAWIHGEETSDAIIRVFDLVASDGALVPGLWRLEIANSLTMAVRRGQIDADYRDAALSDLALLNISVDPHTDTRAWNVTLALADRFRLTLYDAAYLELAQRHSCPLASLDLDLRRAAGVLGLALLGVA
jgi:predicted nucleic acid-binding protein